MSPGAEYNTRKEFSKSPPVERHEVDLHEQALSLIADAKIMMVDDEELNMEVLQVHLESEGYNRFVSVSDSTIAMDRLREELPDVLLLDIVMPTVSGFDILGLIRQDEALRYLPVIVLTSANDPKTKLTALNLGATDFLSKPIDASELALRMRNTLTAMAWQRRMSEVDGLTELPNRTWFTKMLRNRLLSKEKCSDESAVALLNIKRFKSINDSLGPAQGDEVLMTFSGRLIDCFRGGEMQPWMSSEKLAHNKPIVARMDGDRFAIYIPNAGQQKMSDLLEHFSGLLSESLNAPIIVAGQALYLDVSIGVSILDANSRSVEKLINNAETAMRHTRRSGDSAFSIYSEYMDAKARELLSMENGLRTAVEKGEIFLLYQPKVDVATNMIQGAEALVRWQHSEFGLISPVDFIPLAESSGMIVPIGAWIMRESCMQAKRWQDIGFPDFKIAVNVSIRQLHEPDFASVVQQTLEDSGLPPESLVVELTENMIMENAEANTVKLQELKSLGVQISIDDFGTGYSSLSYLQRLPLDQLKIDRSFISEIQSASLPMPIVKAVISLAHDLGLSVVAEGVETAAQLMHIRALKCEEYQGYLCSKPIDTGEFLARLQQQYLKQA